MGAKAKISVAILSWVIKHLRKIIAIAMLCLAASFTSTAIFDEGAPDWMGLVRQSNDPELQKALAIRDERTVTAFGIVFKTYENKFGRALWADKYLSENRGGSVKYLDIAKLAVGLSVDDGRDEFLNEHAAAYDACVKAGYYELADAYVGLLKEVRETGGLGWRVVSKNAFSLSVYADLREKPGLWDWYLAEHTWCDRYLVGFGPEDAAKLADVIAFLKEHERIMRVFDREISALEADDRGAEYDGARLAALAFAEEYAELLEQVVKRQPKIGLMDAMAVIVNNNDLELEAVDLVTLHDRKRTLWDFAAGETGQGVVRFNRDVPQWSEKVVALYGAMNGIGFLYEYYNEANSSALLTVASEILSRCEDAGWAVLQKFRDRDEFKRLMKDPKIGFRVVPYYLRQGEEIFTRLADDPRWVDELLDKNGNLKRQDVSWYEVSDIATVVKKMAEDRPISGAEFGWAAFEVVDLAAMAFTAGGGKVLTSGVKTAGKVTAKKTVGKVSQRISCNMVRRGTAAVVTKKSKTMMARRVSKFFESANKGVKANGKVINKGAKALLGVKFIVHTVPDKGPDFVHEIMEEVGKTTGKFVRAVAEGAGDAFKAAVREVLAIEPGTKPIVLKIVYSAIAVALVLGAVFLLSARRK